MEMPNLTFLWVKNLAGLKGNGESFVAVANDASALYWNPAGITESEKNQIIFSHTN